jgi:long-chain fatty acid transport protein
MHTATHRRYNFKGPSIAAMMTAFAMMSAAVTNTALAADGYLQNGVGARQKALGGAGVADSTDATAVSLNPAGLTNVGNQTTASFSAIFQHGGYDSVDPRGFGFTLEGHHASNAQWAAVPNIAANWRVKWGFADAVAVSVYANGGARTHYSDLDRPPQSCPPGSTGVICGGKLSLNYQQTFLSAALAKEIGPGVSIGLAPILARQTIRVDGVGLFAGGSTDAAHFSNMGTSEAWGAGVRAGLEWKIRPNLRFGIAGNSQVYMSKFGAYNGLFANNAVVNAPASIQTGLALDLSRDVTLLADYKHIWYKGVGAVSNPSTNMNEATGSQEFGSANGPGFGLNDLDVIKLGLEWRRSEKLTLRAGYSYNNAPISPRDADLNILTLGVVQHHFTTGLKYKVSDALDLEVAGMYAPRAHVQGPELLNPGRAVDIYNSQLEFTVGAVYRFGATSNPAPLK